MVHVLGDALLYSLRGVRRGGRGACHPKLEERVEALSLAEVVPSYAKASEGWPAMSERFRRESNG